MNSNWQEFLESLEHLTGFVIVMIALGGLWGLTALMAKLVAKFEKPRAPAQVHGQAPAHAAGPGHARTAHTPAEAAAADGPPEEDLVIIAAAVSTMLGTRHRVVAVKPVASSWGQQGRRDIHASHRIR